ncbi:MAG: MFS transporter [Clostridia bacterium]|nr:MFS transporter [Clostridia bacterium]
MKINLTKEEKASYTLFVVCWLVYAIVCMTKNAFGASIASIVGEGLFTKSLAGTINAGYYVFYGGAQLLLAGLVDKISPVKLINTALIGALISMAGFAVADNFWVMLVLWSITGLLQFAIWPAVIRIIAQYLLPDHRSKAMVYMAFAYCTGMLLNYASASVILKVANWRMIFYIFFGIIIVTMLVWIVVTRKTFPILETQTKLEEKNAGQVKEKPQGTWKVFFASGIVFLLVPSLVRTMMDMGVKSWVPTMITENYAVSPSFASMLTTILLLVNLSGIYIVNAVYPKYIKSEAVCFGLCFVVAFPFMLMLLLIGKIPVGVVVLLLTLFTTFMYSGHQLINVIIPSKFARFNLTGGVASILNAVASFGAVAANFGNGYLADHFGWTVTIIVWNCMAVLAAIFAFLSVRRWNRFIKGSGE